MKFNAIIISALFAFIQIVYAEETEFIARDKNDGAEIKPDYYRVQYPAISLDTCVKVDKNAPFYFDFGFLSKEESRLTTKRLPRIIKISPNPAEDYCDFTLNMLSPSPINLELTDYLGAAIIHLNTSLSSGAANFRLNLSGLTDGLYLLTASGKDFSATEKIIVLGGGSGGNPSFDYLGESAFTNVFAVAAPDTIKVTAYKMYYASKDLIFQRDALPEKMNFAMDTVASPFTSANVIIKLQGVERKTKTVTYYGPGSQVSEGKTSKQIWVHRNFSNYAYSNKCDTISREDTILINYCGYGGYGTNESLFLIMNFDKSIFERVGYSYFSEQRTADNYTKDRLGFTLDSTAAWTFDKGAYRAETYSDLLNKVITGFTLSFYTQTFIGSRGKHDYEDFIPPFAADKGSYISITLYPR